MDGNLELTIAKTLFSLEGAAGQCTQRAQDSLKKRTVLADDLANTLLGCYIPINAQAKLLPGYVEKENNGVDHYVFLLDTLYGAISDLAQYEKSTPTTQSIDGSKKDFLENLGLAHCNGVVKPTVYGLQLAKLAKKHE
jgi:hypothetical protein